jgi:hypothetical protein
LMMMTMPTTTAMMMMIWLSSYCFVEKDDQWNSLQHSIPSIHLRTVLNWSQPTAIYLWFRHMLYVFLGRQHISAVLFMRKYNLNTVEIDYSGRLLTCALFYCRMPWSERVTLHRIPPPLPGLFKLQVFRWMGFGASSSIIWVVFFATALCGRFDKSVRICSLWLVVYLVLGFFSSDYFAGGCWGRFYPLKVF